MKLSLVGKGPGWWQVGQDTDREIWCVSTIFDYLLEAKKKVGLIFQLHTKDKYEPWIKEEQKRVMIIDPSTLFPDAQVLPARALISKHGYKFASTFSWMLAMAVERGYTDINIHGVHMGTGTEYGAQRDSFFYFYGFAEANGVQINIPMNSGIFLGNQKYGVA